MPAVISSRTPEGDQGQCRVCRAFVTIEPSITTLDAPCPCCGSLIWFEAAAVGPPRRAREAHRRKRLPARSLGRRLTAFWQAARSVLVPASTGKPVSQAAGGGATSGVWDAWLDG